MHDSDCGIAAQESYTMTCTCGAVFTVTVAREDGSDRLVGYTCPACSRPHAAWGCLPPKPSLIIAPAAFRALARPAA